MMIIKRAVHVMLVRSSRSYLALIVRSNFDLDYFEDDVIVLTGEVTFYDVIRLLILLKWNCWEYLIPLLKSNKRDINKSQTGLSLSYASEIKMEPPNLKFLDFEITEISLILFLFAQKCSDWKGLNEKRTTIGILIG